jgi:lambda family phage tail tape measure protein
VSTDIAKIGFEADTKEIKTAKDDLEALVPTAGKVEKASTSLSSKIAGLGKTISGGFVSSIKIAGAALAGLAVGMLAAFSLSGAISGLVNIAQKIDDVSKAASKLHESMANMQALGLAADLAGVDMGALSMATQRMNKTLGEAIAKGKGTEGVFKIIGMSAKELAAMPITERMGALADRLNSLNLTADQTAIIMAKLGDRSGTLTALFEGGSEGITQAADALERYNGTLTNVEGKQVEEMNDAWTRLGYSIDAVGNKIVAFAAPYLAPLFDTIANSIGNINKAFGWLMYNTGPLASGIRSIMSAFMSALNPIGTALRAVSNLFKTVFGIDLGQAVQNGTNIMINVIKGSILYIGTLMNSIKLIFQAAFINAVNLALAEVDRLVQGVSNAVSLIGAAFSALSGKGFNFTPSGFETDKLDGGNINEQVAGVFQKAQAAFDKQMTVNNFGEVGDVASKTTDQIKGTTGAVTDLGGALDTTGAKAGAAAEKLTALQQIAKEIGIITAPFDQAKTAYDALQTAQQNGIITGDAYTAMLARIQSAFMATGGTAEQWGKIIEKKTDDMSSALKDLATNSLNGLGSALADLAVDGKADFKALADSIIKDMIRMAFQALIVKPLLGFLGFADGGVIPGGVQAFAKGGAFTNKIVNRPTQFAFANGGGFSRGLMGEAGPEAIVPLKRGPDGSLGVQANGLNGGGSRQVNVGDIIVNYSTPGGDRNQQQQQADMTSAAIRAELENMVDERISAASQYGGTLNPRGN